MATASLTILPASAVSPLRVNAPPSIRGVAGGKLFGNQLANSLAGDLESIESVVNSIQATLKKAVTVTLPTLLSLQTDGVANGSQTLLNLAEGDNITLTDNGDGTVIITSAGLILQTNNVDNGSQTLLDLVAGSHITLTDDGAGGVTIAATGVALRTNNVVNGSQTLLNLAQGTNITLTDNGTGTVTIAAAAGSLTLQTKNIVNGSQTLLDLVEGNNVTLTDTGIGAVVIGVDFDSFTVGTLPASPNGTMFYCSDARNFLDNGAVVGSIAVGAGAGTMVCRLNGSWRTMA